jgi:uncharacterized Zn finger protein (UPF0148 family)
MLTSHCLHCGAPKDPAHYANDYCGGCASIRQETREFVTRENEERNKANAAVLTPENKARLEKAAEADFTGRATRELVSELGIKPLIDMSQALREAMMRRAHHTNTGHTDPRAVFNPGTSDARMANLGMAAKVSPNISIERTR